MPEDPVAPLVADFARYRADEPLRLSDYDTSDTADVDHDEAQRELASLVERIAELQARLYAQESRAVLVVLQASTYEDAVNLTSTPWAPYVVPSDHKWYRNLVVARIVCATLEAMDPRYPDPDPELENYALDELEESASSKR